MSQGYAFARAGKSLQFAAASTRRPSHSVSAGGSPGHLKIADAVRNSPLIQQQKGLLNISRNSPYVIAQRAGIQSLLAGTAHRGGCGCGSCGQSMSLQRVSMPGAASAVIQGKWKCTECEATGPGKPKAKCPDCKAPTTEVHDKRVAFGTWFDGLSGDRKQELLREHGTHEASGGAQQKQKGGGPGGKGGQHDNGVATAKALIRVKYENGEYD